MTVPGVALASTVKTCYRLVENSNIGVSVGEVVGVPLQTVAVAVDSMRMHDPEATEQVAAAQLRCNEGHHNLVKTTQL